MFEELAKLKLFELFKAFYACKQEECQIVSSYLSKMKSYLDTLERLGYAMLNELSVSLILNSLNKDYDQFVHNYIMHSIRKTIAIQEGKIQNDKKKTQGEKGKDKGKNKLAYALKPKILSSLKRDNLEKDSVCHHYKEVGHYKRNCPSYQAELKKRKNASIASTSSLRGSSKLKHGASSLYVEPQNVKVSIHRSARIPQESDRYGFYIDDAEYKLRDLNEPPNYKAALSDPESNKWLEAMNIEMQSMKDNQVWVLVELPPNGRNVRRKWIFRKKTGMDGKVHTFKARLVEKGYTQTYSVDYRETFSLVADIRAIRILLAIAAFYDYEIWQIDEKNAFLNGHLSEDLYIVSARIPQASDRYGFYVDDAEYKLRDLNEPLNYKAALSDPESNKWLEAMNTEMQSMKDNQVWVLVELPPNGRTVRRKWIFKKKTGMDGKVHTVKAHLVEKGYTQTYSVDYRETFSLVADIRAIRILLAIAAFYDYEICQIDDKNAFLNGHLSEDLYIVQPEGFADPKHLNKMSEFIGRLGDIVPLNKISMEMLCDNEPAITIANNLRVLKGARHFQKKYHYIREVIQEREIVLKKVHTYDNVANPFTKPMPFNKHYEHALEIGIVLASSLINNLQTQTSNTLHNAIMEAGSKDRPPMLAPGWKEKCVLDSEGNPTTTTERVFETYKNVTQDIRDQLNVEDEAVQIILTGIDNDIYSTVDACPNACEMWKAIERLKQGIDNDIYSTIDACPNACEMWKAIE
nr:putative retrotransposon Ty1-copia subclass protein [Tanacetum cinerariifolium]